MSQMSPKHPENFPPCTVRKNICENWTFNEYLLMWCSESNILLTFPLYMTFTSPHTQIFNKISTTTNSVSALQFYEFQAGCGTRGLNMLYGIFQKDHQFWLFKYTSRQFILFQIFLCRGRKKNNSGLILHKKFIKRENVTV